MKVGDNVDGGLVMAIEPGKGWWARSVDGRRVWVEDPNVVDDEKPSPPPAVRTAEAPKARTAAIKAPKR